MATPFGLISFIFVFSLCFRVEFLPEFTTNSGFFPPFTARSHRELWQHARHAMGSQEKVTTGDIEDTGLDCATFESAGDVVATSSSVLRASWKGKGEEIAPMGSEGSTGQS